MKERENKPKILHREIDFIKLSRILLSRWYLLLGILVLAIVIAQLYLWSYPKTYSTTGILKFEEKKPELSDLVRFMSQAARTPANPQSEKFIIHSRRILLDAIKRLDYKVSFYNPGTFRNKERYPQQPLDIRLLGAPPHKDSGTLITYHPADEKTFTLSWNQTGQQIKRRFSYNKPIHACSTSFTIQHPGYFNKDSVYLFKFNSPESLYERVRTGLQSNEPAKNSNLIKLSYTDTNPHFAANILNAVMAAYLDYDRLQKTQSATQMIHFINGQLAVLNSAVKEAAQALEGYKQSSGIIDLRMAANHSLLKLSDLESQRSLLKIQELANAQLKNQLTTDQREVAMNLNLEGPIDQLLLTLLHSLNSLLNDKNLLLKTYNSTSGPVNDINRQIEQVKNAALANIHASGLRIRKNSNHLDALLSQLHQQLAALPSAEKNLMNLNRNFEINEKVHSFLSEKKLETQINRAAIIPGATIIEQAQFHALPHSPNVAKVYRTAIITGLLAGILTLVLLRVLNPYIYDKETVEQATDIPIAGVIRKFPGKTEADNTFLLDSVKPRTVFAESVRAVRTYLNFLATEKESRVICITSEAAGEGKSFIALLLSGTLAMIDKKVILIGADLRRPKLHKALGLSNQKGLSNYLHQAQPIDDLIQHTHYKNLDFISSGPVPPDPSALLHSENLSALIAKLQTRYDRILIDSAPVGLVSDSIPLLCLADINLFIIRYGISKQSALPIPQGLANEYQLKNMVIVLNAFEENRLHAGYYKDPANPGTLQYYADYNGYASSGYYEEEKKLKWWKIIKNKYV